MSPHARQPLEVIKQTKEAKEGNWLRLWQNSYRHCVLDKYPVADPCGAAACATICRVFCRHMAATSADRALLAKQFEELYCRSAKRSRRSKWCADAPRACHLVSWTLPSACSSSITCAKAFSVRRKPPKQHPLRPPAIGKPVRPSYFDWMRDHQFFRHDRPRIKDSPFARSHKLQVSMRSKCHGHWFCSESCEDNQHLIARLAGQPGQMEAATD